MDNQSLAGASGPLSPTLAPPRPGDDLVLRLWRMLIRRLRLVFAVAFLSAAAAAGVAFSLAPVYRAEVAMVPAGEDKSMGSLAALSSQFGGLTALTGVDASPDLGTDLESIATLKSRKFTTAFFKDKNLLPVLFGDKWDAASGNWKKGLFGSAKAPTLWEAYRLFDDEVRDVKRNKKTGLVTLSIEWSDPQQAAQWANELVDRVNAALQARAIDEAQRSIAYLNEQLAKTTVLEVQQAIYRLIEKQVKTIMLANVRGEYAFKVIDPAVVPERKVRPKRALLTLLGGFGGLLLGVVVALVLGLREGGGRGETLAPA